MAHYIEDRSKFRGTTYTPPKPDREDSPPPPKNGHAGESQQPAVAEQSPEAPDDKQLTATVKSDDEQNNHHQHQGAAESGDAAEETSKPTDENDATPDVMQAWGELTGFIAEAPHASGSGPVVNSVVNVPKDSGDAAGTRNYQKLTVSEEDRLLMCLSMGLSMRAAARAIGCHHTTFVKRAKRDKDFLASIEQAKQRGTGRCRGLDYVTRLGLCLGNRE